MLANETLRVATYHVGLKRAGPGLLLRDILAGQDPQIISARNVIAKTNPDILLLTRFDFDLQNQALTAFAKSLSRVGVEFRYIFALAPNAGVGSGLDLNGDGYLNDAADAHGYGEFAGNGGMAILSRFPIDAAAAQDFTGFLWGELPGARLPDLKDEAPEQVGRQRLSSVAHWDVPVLLPDGNRLHLLTYHATTPAFDGPEDRNGLRNHDENAFWLRYLEGALPVEPPKNAFIIMGDANLDPVDGDGQHQAIRALLDSEWVQDPKPRSPIGREISNAQGGVNSRHIGDPSLDTADWKDRDGPGNLRVDYVLPSQDLTGTGAGVVWPAPEDQANMLGQNDGNISWHGLVWVDIAW
ncbi:MAG: endonuclease/exonuclease/phosphatase family protein [Paracoccaceae bacterium]